MTRQISFFMLASILAVALPVQTVLAASGAKPGTSTITEIALGEGNFEVLVAALVRTDLVGALSGGGQFTVFAPTDAAFIELFGVGTTEEAIAAIESLPVPALTNILLFHVTEGRRGSRSVLGAPQYRMLNGDRLTREEVVDAGLVPGLIDISARNGIIHVIDSVLVPQS